MLPTENLRVVRSVQLLSLLLDIFFFFLAYLLLAYITGLLKETLFEMYYTNYCQNVIEDIVCSTLHYPCYEHNEQKILSVFMSSVGVLFKK